MNPMSTDLPAIFQFGSFKFTDNYYYQALMFSTVFGAYFAIIVKEILYIKNIFQWKHMFFQKHVQLENKMEFADLIKISRIDNVR